MIGAWIISNFMILGAKFRHQVVKTLFALSQEICDRFDQNLCLFLCFRGWGICLRSQVDRFLRPVGDNCIFMSFEANFQTQWWCLQPYCMLFCSITRVVTLSIGKVQKYYLETFVPLRHTSTRQPFRLISYEKWKLGHTHIKNIQQYNTDYTTNKFVHHLYNMASATNKTTGLWFYVCRLRTSGVK